MERTDSLTLVDDLSGETVDAPAGDTAAELIARRLADADHPRADFRGQALEFHLVDPDGAQLPTDGTLPAGTVVRLTSPDAADVITRRNRWLEDLATDGTGSESVAASTQLALVERTESRLDEVARLRAELAARRPPPPKPTSRFRPGGLLLTALVLLIVGGIFAAWIWWFIDELDTTAQGRGVGQNGVATTAVFAEEEAVAIEGGDVVVGGGSGAPIDACAVLDIDGEQVPGELELELGCEVAIIPVDVADDGASIEIDARSAGGDPIVWVYDEDGNEVAFNDDSGGLNSFIAADLEPGPHQIHVGNLTQQPNLIEVAIELG